VSLPSWTAAAAIPVQRLITLPLTVLILRRVPFCFFICHHINGTVFFWCALIFLRGADCCPEAERNLTGSLSPCPMLEHGIGVSFANMMVLPEGYPLGQILRFDVFALSPFQL
jgi:hypothetical protein